jgi:hypothetical protein
MRQSLSWMYALLPFCISSWEGEEHFSPVFFCWYWQRRICLSCLHWMSVAKFWSGWVAYIADKWLLCSPFLSEGESQCSLSWRTQSPLEVRWWFSLSFTCRWGQSSCTGILLSTQIGFCMSSICRGTRLLRCTFSGKRRISDKWSLDTCSCTDETLYLCGSL